MKNSLPTVSIVLPTYNRAHLIERAVNSILNQTYKDFELIIVDDGSTDNTEEVVNNLKKKDSRIKYIKYSPNKGANVARNRGIRESKGKYVAFQDSDDEWLPEKLEKQVKLLDESPDNVGVVYTGFWRIYEDRKTYIPGKLVKHREGDIFEELLKGNFVSTPTLLVKRKCFEKEGYFDEELPRLQDWELVIRLSKKCEFRIIDEPLILEYDQNDSISKSDIKLIKAFELLIEKHLEDFKNNKRMLSYFYFSIGFDKYMKGEIKDSKLFFIKAIKNEPFNKKNILFLLIQVIPRKILLKLIKYYKDRSL